MDYGGIALLIVGLGSLQIVLVKGQRVEGFATVQVLGPDGRALKTGLQNVNGLQPMADVVLEGRVGKRDMNVFAVNGNPSCLKISANPVISKNCPAIMPYVAPSATRSHWLKYGYVFMNRHPDERRGP